MALADGSTLGLALSGGGFRATLFSLGSLLRLNDAMLLQRLDRVTSVSGGSILAGVLASRWNTLQFAEGRATNFASAIVEPIQKFCSETADIEAGILGWITPFRSAGDYLEKHYRNELFGEISMKDLPKRKTNEAPLFVFYATNMQTGRSFRFRQDMIADYRLGINETANIPLAKAVTASSAFPPLFSPIGIKTNASDWREEKFGGDSDLLHRLRKEIVLADGGIYDNMGLESLSEDIMLVSDAGAPFELEESPKTDYFSQLGRVRDVLIDQTRALRKRSLIGAFERGELRGAYWGIGTEIGEYPIAERLVHDTAFTRALEAVPTRLAAVDSSLQAHLINWGYSLTDAALRSRAKFDIPMSPSLPLPDYPLE
jgi:NTE family protein